MSLNIQRVYDGFPDKCGKRINITVDPEEQHLVTGLWQKRNYRIDSDFDSKDSEKVFQLFTQVLEDFISKNFQEDPKKFADSITNQMSIALLITKLYLDNEKDLDKTLNAFKELDSKIANCSQKEKINAINDFFSEHFLEWIENEMMQAQNKEDNLKSSYFSRAKRLNENQRKIVKAIQKDQKTPTIIGGMGESVFAPAWYVNEVKKIIPNKSWSGG